MQQVDWFTRLHLQLHEADRSGLWFIANYNGEMDGKYSTCAKQILQKKKKDLSYFLQCVGLPCADGTQQTSVVLIVYRRRGKKKTDIVDKVLVLKMLNV